MLLRLLFRIVLACLAGRPKRRCATKIAETDLERLKVALSIREYHHKALWEEEKHFTWLLGLVLTGIGVVFATQLGVPIRANAIAALAILGVLFSVFALRVVSREYVYFSRAAVRFARAINRCFPNDPEPEPLKHTRASITQLIRIAISGNAGVVDVFRLVFVVFGVFFILIAALAIATLWRIAA